MKNFKTYFEGYIEAKEAKKSQRILARSRFPEYLWITMVGSPNEAISIFKRTRSINGFYKMIKYKSVGHNKWLHTKNQPARPFNLIKKQYGEENVESMTKEELNNMMILDQI